MTVTLTPAATGVTAGGGWLTLVIEDVISLAEGVVGVALASEDGAELPTWKVGAHLAVRLPSGLERHYSLCGDPADRFRYTVAVLAVPDGRGGSRELHEVARPGATLEVSGPRNQFPLEPAAAYLFLAGGIGITPLLPMLSAATAARAQWRLVYGGRSASTMAFGDALASYGGLVDLWPEDERGRVDLAAVLADTPAGALVYVCGPGPMLDAVTAEAGRYPHLAGLRTERFSASAGLDTDGDAFEVVLGRTGGTLTIGPDQTILEALLDVVPDHPHSCTEGFCGECVTTVLEGVPDHRDDYLTPAERLWCDRMTVCVSRCVGTRLVLDA